MRNEFGKNFKAILFYLLIVVVLGVLRRGFDFSWSFVFQKGLFLIGGIFGFLLLDLEKVFWVYWIRPVMSTPGESLRNTPGETACAGESASAWRRGLIGSVKEIINFSPPAAAKLPFTNAVFIVFWLFFSFFIITSSGSYFAGGAVVALLARLMIKLWQKYRQDPQALSASLFWMVKREVGLQEQRVFLYVVTVFFVLLTLMVG